MCEDTTLPSGRQPSVMQRIEERNRKIPLPSKIQSGTSFASLSSLQIRGNECAVKSISIHRHEGVIDSCDNQKEVQLHPQWLYIEWNLWPDADIPCKKWHVTTADGISEITPSSSITKCMCYVVWLASRSVISYRRHSSFWHGKLWLCVVQYSYSSHLLWHDTAANSNICIPYVLSIYSSRAINMLCEVNGIPLTVSLMFPSNFLHIYQIFIDIADSVLYSYHQLP